MSDIAIIGTIIGVCATAIALATKIISALTTNKFAAKGDLNKTIVRVEKLEKDSDRYKMLFLPLQGSINELKVTTEKLDEQSGVQGKDIAILSTKMQFVVEAVKNIQDGVECIKRGKG